MDSGPLPWSSHRGHKIKMARMYSYDLLETYSRHVKHVFYTLSRLLHIYMYLDIIKMYNSKPVKHENFCSSALKLFLSWQIMFLQYYISTYWCLCVTHSNWVNNFTGEWSLGVFSVQHCFESKFLSSLRIVLESIKHICTCRHCLNITQLLLKYIVLHKRRQFNASDNRVVCVPQLLCRHRQ